MGWRYKGVEQATVTMQETQTGWGEYVPGDLNSLIRAISDFTAISVKIDEELAGGERVADLALAQAAKARDFIDAQPPEITHECLKTIGIIRSNTEARSLPVGARRAAIGVAVAGMLISVAPTKAAAAGNDSGDIYKVATNPDSTKRKPSLEDNNPKPWQIEQIQAEAEKIEKQAPAPKGPNTGQTSVPSTTAPTQGATGTEQVPVSAQPNFVSSSVDAMGEVISSAGKKAVDVLKKGKDDLKKFTGEVAEQYGDIASLLVVQEGLNNTPEAQDNASEQNEKLSARDQIYQFLTTTEFKYLGNQPMTRLQAAAFMGNFSVESAGYQSNIIQSHKAYNENKAYNKNVGGYAFGLVQWDGVRRVALLEFVDRLNERRAVEGKSMLSWRDLDVQLLFLKDELDTTESRILTNSTFRRTKSIATATKLVRKIFERPGAAHDRRRIEEARKAYNDAGGRASSDDAQSLIDYDPYAVLEGEESVEGSDPFVDEGTYSDSPSNDEGVSGLSSIDRVISQGLGDIGQFLVEFKEAVTMPEVSHDACPDGTEVVKGIKGSIELCAIDGTEVVYNSATDHWEDKRYGGTTAAGEKRLAVNAEIAEDARRMVEAALADGITLKVTIGYRTEEEQCSIFIRNHSRPEVCEAWIRPVPGNWKTTTMKSNHRDGKSFDVHDDVTLKWMRENAHKFNFIDDVYRAEGWDAKHWTWKRGVSN